MESSNSKGFVSSYTMVKFFLRKLFEHNKEAITIYGFLVIVWIFRVVIAIINPCPPEANVWLSYGQFAGLILIAIMLLIPFVRIKK